MIVVLLLLAAFLAWTWCCVEAGAIYDRARVEADDLTARDAWHNQRGDI